MSTIPPPAKVHKSDPNAIRCPSCGEYLASIGTAANGDRWVESLPGWDTSVPGTLRQSRRARTRGRSRKRPMAITGSFWPGLEDTVKVAWGHRGVAITEVTIVGCPQCNNESLLDPSRFA